MSVSRFPKVLMISSANPFKGPGKIAWDNYLVIRDFGIEVDFLTMYKTDNPEVMSVFDEQNSDGWKFKLKYCRKSLKDRVLNKIGWLKSSKSGFCFFYRKESAPPVDEKWVLKKVDKKYDLVIVVFWQGLLSFSTIEKLYDKLKCQFHFRFVDYSPMSGGCHFTMDCDRYKVGCGMCPAFGSTNKCDFTAYNVKERMRIYDKVKPVIYGNSYMQSFYKDSFLLKNMQYELSYPIVNESEFTPLNRLDIRMELGISETKKFLILFGCQHLNDVRKGINYLFEALSIFYETLKEEQRKDVLLLVIGNQYNEVPNEISFDTLNFGYVDYLKLSKLYAVSDIFLSPSVHDAGPMMVNQSLSCGTPVVAFEMGAAIDVIKDKGTGYCAEMKNSADFARGIYEIYKQTDEERQLMRNKCRELALQTSAREVRVKAMLDIYEKYKRKREKNSPC